MSDVRQEAERRIAHLKALPREFLANETDDSALLAALLAQLAAQEQEIAKWKEANRETHEALQLNAIDANRRILAAESARDAALGEVARLTLTLERIRPWDVPVADWQAAIDASRLTTP